MISFSYFIYLFLVLYAGYYIGYKVGREDMAKDVPKYYPTSVWEQSMSNVLKEQIKDYIAEKKIKNSKKK